VYNNEIKLMDEARSKTLQSLNEMGLNWHVKFEPNYKDDDELDVCSYKKRPLSDRGIIGATSERDSSGRNVQGLLLVGKCSCAGYYCRSALLLLQCYWAKLLHDSKHSVEADPRTSSFTVVVRREISTTLSVRSALFPSVRFAAASNRRKLAAIGSCLTLTDTAPMFVRQAGL
jgi:hypothetical protein